MAPLPVLPCAHNMLSSIWFDVYPKFPTQSALLIVLTWPSCRVLGWLPPDRKVPQPVIQHELPSGMSFPSGKQAAPTQSLNSTGLSRRNKE